MVFLFTAASIYIVQRWFWEAEGVKVLKAINNNVVSCEDEDGIEVIAMGRGLGFSLHSGDELKPEQAEKIFRMQTPDEARRLKDLFETLPQQQIELCSRIVDRATKDLGRRLCSTVYITLTDHICFAIERQKKGTVFQNTLLTEVRTFYPREYAVGKYGLELLERELSIHFPDDEAANIALHLVNAEYENSIQDTLRITQTLHDVLSTLSGWPQLNFDPESSFYDEFTVHLKFLVFRAFSGQIKYQKDPEFVKAVKACYPYEFRCAQQIVKGLELRGGAKLPAEEYAYLTASLHRTCKPG